MEKISEKLERILHKFLVLIYLEKIGNHRYWISSFIYTKNIRNIFLYSLLY
jgi:hypothetical protein